MGPRTALFKRFTIGKTQANTHSGNTSRLVNLAVVHWLVSYEDENEYGNDNENEIED